MTRFLLCLSVILAVGLLVPSRSWSDPERPTYDIPHEYENSGDDDMPHVEGPVIQRPSPGKRAESIRTPRTPTQENRPRDERLWIMVFFERIKLIRPHEMPRP